MTQSLGARLRAQRERQQIALDAIAANTKISPSLLEGLERDDVSHWPPGIFRRAYVRAYARAIGLDPDGVVREFLALHPDSVEVPPAGATVWPGNEGRAEPGTRLGRLVESAMAAVPALLRPAPRRADPDEAIRDAHGALARQASGVDRAGAGKGAGLHPQLGLAGAAHLCCRLGRAADAREVAQILADAMEVLDVVGLIVWQPDVHARVLTPALAQGYSTAVLSRFAGVSVDADNAVAAAFRSSAVCVVDSPGAAEALAVPLVGSRGCVGVLAIELAPDRELSDAVRAFATILAAQLTHAPLAAPAHRPRVLRRRSTGTG